MLEDSSGVEVGKHHHRKGPVLVDDGDRCVEIAQDLPALTSLTNSVTRRWRASMVQLSLTREPDGLDYVRLPGALIPTLPTARRCRVRG
jgi:hypothetical protein